MIYTINEYKKDDVPSLKALWTETFGDSAALVDKFFELLPSMGSGLVAERFGEIFGAAYIIETELWNSNGFSKKIGYIYAVAVEESERGNGLGAELVRACMRYAWENGIDICCTLPAEPSLYNWYEKTSGLSPATYCVYDTVYPSDCDADIKEIYADEYGFARSDILKGRNYVNPSYPYLLFQEAIFREYGGGYYACGDGIACGYIDGDTLYIKEALNDSPEFIPALCKKLGAQKVIVRRASCSGVPYICAYETADFPADTIWNLTLD